MREIKFRAWDEKLKTMVYTNELVGGVEYDCHPVRAINIILNEDDYGCVFMQYTGLKDRNDKEIYEGDLLQHPNGTIAEIRYSDYLAAFVAVYAQNGDIEMDFLDKEIVNTCEIVGNIYENPELLEAKGNE